MSAVLSVTSECAPLVKTGGLADVAGALPAALAPLGWQMRTLLPGYPPVLAALRKPKPVLTLKALFGGDATVLADRVAGLDILALDAPHLYDRHGTLYLDQNGNDFSDNPERFAALSFAGAEIARSGIGKWRPDLVHCHDWQAGLVPYYLRGSGVPTVITIHNMAFQGLVSPDRLGALRLDPADYTPSGLEYWGNVSTLKAGLRWADRITTVSPTYAIELTTPEFGMGLEGLMKEREADVCGILNGIDTKTWDPATDVHIARFKTARGKSLAKKRLRREFGLPETDGPLAVVVSRLSHQKGLDVLLAALPALIDRGGQLVLLGSGDRALEMAFRQMADHPNVAVRIGYDEPLAHRIIAGGDAILVPSRFEPCGLTQLYGLRYGTVPVVARTGGLADTVIDASPIALRGGVATGLHFHPVTAHALAAALLRLIGLFHDRPTWTRLQKNAMAQPVGWDASAAEYAALYADMTAGSAAETTGGR